MKVNTPVFAPLDQLGFSRGVVKGKMVRDVTVVLTIKVKGLGGAVEPSGTTGKLVV